MKLRPLAYEDFTALGRLTLGADSRPAPAAPEAAAEADLALARARGKARAEGFEEGVRETEARIERELQDTLTAVAAAIEHARADAAARERETVAALQAIVTRFLGALAPRLAEAALVGEIEALVAEAAAAGEADLVVHVAPARVDEVAAALATRSARCAVRGDEALGRAAARAAFAGGVEEVDLAAMADRALAILDAHLSAARAAPPPSDESGEIDR